MIAYETTTQQCPNETINWVTVHIFVYMYIVEQFQKTNSLEQQITREITN